MPVPLQILASYTDSTGGVFLVWTSIWEPNPTTDYVNDDWLGNEIEYGDM